jgi:MFS family permease
MSAVYVSLRNAPTPAGTAAAVPAGRTRSAVGRNVVLLGLGPLAFGLMDGVYQGGTALVRILGGLLADRRDRHKEVAGFGYALSAVCKLGLLAVGSAWGAVSAVLVLDRLGKGVRTAPRDALISLSADPRALGRAFGVHRALDTTGALLGPLLAFVLLAQRPDAYGGVFVTSFAIALVGLGILILFVQGRSGRAAVEARPAITLRSALGLLRGREFRGITIVAGALGLFTISDAFVYLLIQRQTNMDARWFPLLFLGTALAYLLLAVPIGHLADRVGRGRVFLAGYLPLAGTYLVLLFVPLRAPVVLLCLALLGCYYASTDGVLMAVASSRVPERLRTSGLAIVTTATASTRFVASLSFGALWVLWGPHRSALVFLVGLLAALALSTALLRAETS